MRWWTLVFVLAGCAARSVPSDAKNGGGHDLRRADLPPGSDLKRASDLADPGDVDLGGGSDEDLAAPFDVDLGSAASDLRAASDLLTTDLLASNCAAQEDCFNTLDDDCVGGVNNGCPSSISIGTPVSLGYVGGSGGGGGSVRCPSGQMVGAARYFYDDNDLFMAGMGLFCSTPTLVKGASAYTISATNITSATPVNFYGANQDYFDDSDNCVASGALGTVWHHDLTGNNGTLPGYYVDGVKSQCGLATVTLGSSNQLTISFVVSGALTGWSYTPGVTPTVKNCPSDSVLVGYDYRIGSWMDAIAPVCAPIVVSYL